MITGKVSVTNPAGVVVFEAIFCLHEFEEPYPVAIPGIIQVYIDTLASKFESVDQFRLNFHKCPLPDVATITAKYQIALPGRTVLKEDNYKWNRTLNSYDIFMGKYH